MPAVYDNWEKLMDAVLKEERYRQLCFADSRSPSLSDESDLSSRSPLHDVTFHFQNSPGISSRFEHQTEGEVRLSDDREKSKAKAIENSSSISGVISLARYMLEKKFVVVSKSRRLREEFFNANGGVLFKQKLSSRESNMKSCIIFSAKELEKATGNYAEERVLGRGCYGTGTTYKGILHDEQQVAIRKSRVSDYDHVEDFVNAVIFWSQVKHQNIMKLLGCCLETKTPILVYEFVSNSSLYYHIHNSQQYTQFTWDDRLRIALEAARALEFAHSRASMPIVHRGITSSNILVDDNYTAKVSGLEDSTWFSMQINHEISGYLDPEYFVTHQLTEKSDVYSFGVVLAELMTGRKAVTLMESGEPSSLVWFFLTSLQENRLFQILDPRVEREGNVEQIYFVAELVKRCVCLHGANRPTMKEVAFELEGLMKLSVHPWAQEELRNRYQVII